MPTENYRASKVHPIKARIIIRQTENLYQSPEQQRNYSYCIESNFSDLKARFPS